MSRLSHIIAQSGFMSVGSLQLSTFDDLTTHHPFPPYKSRQGGSLSAMRAQPTPSGDSLWGALRTLEPEIHAQAGSMTDVRRALQAEMRRLETAPVNDGEASARWRRLNYLHAAFLAADARRR